MLVFHILKSLGSKQNIAKAKLEILEPLTEKDLAVLNGDSPELWETRRDIISRTVFFGKNQGDVRAKNIKSYSRNGLSLTYMAVTVS